MVGSVHTQPTGAWCPTRQRSGDVAKFNKPAEGAGPSTSRSSTPARSRTRTRSLRSTSSSNGRPIFRRTWLNVGRVEQLPRKGSYFTKELARRRHLGRGRARRQRRDPRVPQHLSPSRQQARVERPPRRGDEGTAVSSPASTTAGATASTATCTFVQQETEFFDLDKAEYGLVPVAGRRVGGVHLREPRRPAHRSRCATTSVSSPPGSRATLRRDDPGLQVPGRRRSQLEALHRRVRRVLPRTRPALEAVHRRRSPQAAWATASKALHYDIDGPHGMQSSWGGMAPPKDPNMVKPIERVLRSGNFGPWDRPDIPGLDPLPPGLNPSRHRSWGLDSYVFFPNFMIVVWAPGWYLTYHYWPTAYNRHIFEGTLYFVRRPRRPRPHAPGAGRGHVQGVRPAGLQHPRGDPDACSSRGRSRSSRSTTRRSCSATSTRRPASTSTSTRTSVIRAPARRRRRPHR